MVGRRSSRGVMVLGLAACGGGGTGDGGGVTVTDSAGVTIVANGAVGDWGEVPPELEEVLRIGVVDGPDEYSLHEVSAVEVADDGTVFVALNAAEAVRAYGADGEFLRAFVRKGDGPGELRHVESLRPIGDSAIAVAGYAAEYRSPVYGVDGKLLHVPDASAHPDSTIRILAGATDGRWLGATMTLPVLYEGPSTPERNETVRIQLHLFRFDPGAPEHRETPGSVTVFEARWCEADTEFHVPPFGVVFAMEFDGRGRMLRMQDGRYRIEFFEAGRLTRVVTRAHERRVATEDDYAALQHSIESRDWRANWPGSGPPVDLRPRDLAVLACRWAMREEHEVPAVRSIVASADGSFWAERADHLDAVTQFTTLAFFDRRDAGSRWDVFDAQGRFLATVDLPRRFVPMDARGLEVTGVLRDELDVEYVVTYRVRRAD